MNEHECKLPPLEVASWPADDDLACFHTPEHPVVIDSPQQPVQAPLGTVWICGACKTVWVIEERQVSLDAPMVRGWHHANIWTANRELNKAGVALHACNGAG